MFIKYLLSYGNMNNRHMYMYVELPLVINYRYPIFFVIVIVACQ